MKRLGTLILTLISTLSFAQNSLKESSPVSIPSTGYVITEEGDTLNGKISAEKMLAYLENDNILLEEISFNNYSGNKVSYEAKSIRGFAQKRPFPLNNFQGFASIDPEYAHFESMPHPEEAGKFVFAERLMKGSIQVFAAPKLTAEGEDGELVVVEDTKRYFVVKDNGEVILLEDHNYKEHFTSLFGDCEEMTEFLSRHPQMWEFDSFHLLVELYNDHFFCN